MTASITSTCRIEAYPVPEHARLGSLPRHFGVHMLAFEDRTYAFLKRFCAAYNGGVWTFVELSNGGFYMSPPEGTYDLTVESNGFQGSLSADAAGIAVCLFAFSHLSFEYATDIFSQHFGQLYAYADQHPEAAQIFAAID